LNYSVDVDWRIHTLKLPFDAQEANALIW